MRFTSLALTALAIAAAFAIGRQSSSALSLRAQPVQFAATTTFSHFECYTAANSSQFSGAVKLTDQFVTYTTKIGVADLFCTPVKKTLLTGHPLPVTAPADHLMCYHITGPQVNQARAYQNQLQRGTVNAMVPAYLCVPTHKFK